MKSKIITAIGATSLIAGMFALQGCFESNYPGYGGYGYSSGPAYYSEPAPVVVRDYDEHRSWHDRDSWEGNRRDADDNHKESVDHNRGGEREVHASADRDHDNDRH